MGPEIIVVADPTELAEAAAEWIMKRVRATLADQGHCSLMLTGGSTPGRVYERLAAEPAFPRARVTYYLGDERCVPPTDPESNYRLALETLFPDGPPAGTVIHRMRGEDPEADKAAADYAALVPDIVDVLLLGVGPDGHVASLFPGSNALHEGRHKALAVIGPKPPPRRLTVTPPVIRSARHVLVMATGAAKAPVLARALREPVDPAALPVQLALGGTWILDREAAAEIESAAVDEGS
jgi:6-phosphogluconolactonase